MCVRHNVINSSLSRPRFETKQHTCRPIGIEVTQHRHSMQGVHGVQWVHLHPKGGENRAGLTVRGPIPM